MNPATNELLLQNFNQTIFELSSKLDKVLAAVVQCGFSLNELPKEPEQNPYVETVHQLIQKLKFFVQATSLIHAVPDSEEKQNFKSLLVTQVKALMKNLSEIQNTESLIVFKTLDNFLQVICLVIG